ncbi:MAG: RES family NAD+ phosphorylase [Flavobacterium sp.]
MKVFRIEREKYLATTLKGIGAALSEGFRWNSANTHLVYTAESRALATLEIAVHLDLTHDLPTDRFYVELFIPDDIDILDLPIASLPEGWDSKPPLLETQYVGDDFVLQSEALILRVPSSIIPQEYNYLINPYHPEIKKIEIIGTEKLVFDHRLQTK